MATTKGAGHVCVHLWRRDCETDVARGLAKSFVPMSTLGILAQHVMMKVLLRDAWIALLRRQFGAESLLIHPLQNVG